MSNGKMVWAWVVIAVIVIGGGWWLLRAHPAATSNEPIKIGFIGPLTGDAAAFGIPQKAAVQLAVEEINAAGGLNGAPVTVVYEDGQCSPTNATNAVQKLINIDHVIAIIGGTCSAETSALGPIAMQNKVIELSPSSSAPNLSNLGKYFFRAYPSDALQGGFGAKYVYTKLGARKVAVLYQNSDYGTGIKNVFEEQFKALGGTIVEEEGAPQTETDYRTQLSKIKAANPDLIYVAFQSPGGVKAAMPEAKALGIKVTIFGADAWDDPSVAPAVSGNGTLYYSVPMNNVPDDFKTKILAITGSEEVPVGSTNAYDEVKILAAAIAQVGTDPDKLADAIRAVSYDGISGHIEFDQNGDVKDAGYLVKQIANGKAVVVE